MIELLKYLKDFVVYNVVQKILDMLFFIARGVGIVFGEIFYFIDKRKKEKENKNLNLKER